MALHVRGLGEGLRTFGIVIYSFGSHALSGFSRTKAVVDAAADAAIKVAAVV